MANTYPVGLVGEQHFARAVAALTVGEPVIVEHEPANRHDPNALVVRRQAGDCIGYIPRESWLQGAIHDEGQAVRATVCALHEGVRGFVQVTIMVEMLGRAAATAAAPDISTPPANPEAAAAQPSRVETLIVPAIIFVAIVAAIFLA